jgi:hypothetical protein
METKFHASRTVITIVPIKASNAAFRSVMVGSMNVATVGLQLRLLLGLLASLKKATGT